MEFLQDFKSAHQARRADTSHASVRKSLEKNGSARSVTCFPFSVAFHGDVVSLGDHWLKCLERGVTRVKHANELLRSVLRVGHNFVEDSEIVAPYINGSRTKKCLESGFADADVQAKDSIAV